MPNQPFSDPGYQTDEISLSEIWSILLKRKLLIFIIFGGCLILTGIYLLLAKPVYESRAVIRVGQVGQEGSAGSLQNSIPLQDPDILVQKLKEEYRVDDDSEGARRLPLLSEVINDGKTEEKIITLTARGSSAAQAREFLTGVTDKLLEQHKQLYDQAIGLQQARLNSLKAQLQQLNETIIQYDRRINAGSNSALAAILTLEKAKLAEQRPELERQISELALAMSPLYSRPSYVLRQPTLPVKPVQPKKSLYLALAMVLGLMLGVFAAFFAEFLAKFRAEAHTKQV